ncbi:MAG: DNA-3-methyladenine glycosylase I [Proteobacteria bacterium]|nr:DNA-3-methyladenine glycosylase I [Pseudomonadota bacterium]
MTTTPCPAANDGKPRCRWVLGGNALYYHYHDNEWGVPVHDDRTHFEFLLLEGAQAGLSWTTVLNKRENYRQAFACFDPQQVAQFTDNDQATLLTNAGIIRNRLKIAAAIGNARAFQNIAAQFGTFDNYIWGFVDGKPQNNCRQSTPPATTETSDKLSKDMKKRGFKFVGSTIMYSYMQAVGMVNDHEISCYRYKNI